MLSAETTKALMEWEPVNARLITARFYGTATNIAIVQRPQQMMQSQRKKWNFQAIPCVVNMLGTS